MESLISREREQRKNKLSLLNWKERWKEKRKQK
jgi:hypothetical protein